LHYGLLCRVPGNSNLSGCFLAWLHQKQKKFFETDELPNTRAELHLIAGLRPLKTKGTEFILRLFAKFILSPPFEETFG